MAYPETKTDKEFESRRTLLMARGLGQKEAAEQIEQEDPALYDRWQKQEASSSRKVRPVPTEDDDEDEDDEDKKEAEADDDDAEESDDEEHGDGDDGDEHKPSTTPKPKKLDDGVKRKKKPSRASQFQQFVSEKQLTGMTRSEAVRAVSKDRPKLRQAMIGEANANARRPRIVSGNNLGTVQSEWNAAIAGKMKTGLPRALAIRAVSKENPKLRERFVAAANN